MDHLLLRRFSHDAMHNALMHLTAQGKFSVDGSTITSLRDLEIGAIVRHSERGLGKVMEFKVKQRKLRWFWYGACHHMQHRC